MGIRIRSSDNRIVRVFLVVACCAVAACASTSAPAPQADLQAAHFALADARRAAAPEYAPLHWKAARQTMADAAAAAAAGHDHQAGRLAETARFAAEFARLRADRIRSALALSELQANIDALRRQLASGDVDPEIAAGLGGVIQAGLVPAIAAASSVFAVPHRTRLAAERVALGRIASDIERADHERDCLHSMLRGRTDTLFAEVRAGHEDCL